MLINFIPACVEIMQPIMQSRSCVRGIPFPSFRTVTNAHVPTVILPCCYTVACGGAIKQHLQQLALIRTEENLISQFDANYIGQIQNQVISTMKVQILNYFGCKCMRTCMYCILSFIFLLEHLNIPSLLKFQIFKRPL